MGANLQRKRQAYSQPLFGRGGLGYDATRCYQVVDNNSKTTFDVTFYLYGDVVSGWDVTVADKDSSKK